MRSYAYAREDSQERKMPTSQHTRVRHHPEPPTLLSL
nr:MAG TPA: hypothetical protein [Bacteriophage sp.]